MTAPAPSPGPAKRSKRLYVYWGIALTLLVTVGLVCWLIVAPVLRVHSAIRATQGLKIPQDAAIANLGGPERAVQELDLYIRMPGISRDDKHSAVNLLGHCGQPAVKSLTRYLKHEDYYMMVGAINALGRIGPDAAEAAPALAPFRDHNDSDVMIAADRAIMKICRPEGKKLEGKP